MKLLKFLGHSDDIFQYGIGVKAIDGDETYSIGGVHAFLIKDEDGNGLYVCGTYAPQAISGACWMVGIAQLDENIPLPCWAIYYEDGLNGYSPTLVLRVPDNTEITPIQLQT